MTHNEVACKKSKRFTQPQNAQIEFVSPAEKSGDGAILPTWTAVDTANVRTSRELWETMKRDGWRVDVSLSRITELEFIDSFTIDIVLSVSDDWLPLRSLLSTWFQYSNLSR